MGFNEALTQHIFQNAQKVASDEMARDSAANKLHGAAQVARGSSLAEVKKNSPFMERIFGGGATMAGANDQFVQQGVNSYINQAATQMDTLREMKPETFAAQQIDVLSEQMTGDPELDDRMILAGKESIAAVVKLQKKQNMKWVQETELAGFNANLQEAMNAHFSIAAGNNDTDDTKDSTARLVKAMTRNERMDPGAHKDAIMAFARAGLAKGDASIMELMLEMELPLEGKDYESLEIGKDKYFKVLRENDSFAFAAAQAELADYSKTDNADPVEMARMNTAIEDRWGKGAVGSKLVGYLMEHIKKEIVKAQKIDYTTLYANGKAMDQTPSNGLKGFYGYKEAQQMLVDAGHIDPKTALANEISLWRDNDVIDKRQARKWTNTSKQVIMPNGDINQDYLKMFQEMAPWMKARPDKVRDMIDDPADWQRMMTIQDQIADNMAPEAAMLMWKDKDVVKDAQAAESNPLFNTLVNDTIEELFDGDIELDVADSEFYIKDENKLLLSELLKQGMIYGLRQGGSTANLKDAGLSWVSKRVEKLNGRVQINQGKSFGERAGYTKQAGEAIVNHFLDVNQAADFPGFSPENLMVVVDQQQDTVSFWHNDQGVRRAVPGTKLGISFPISQVAEQYTAKLAVEKERREAAERIASDELNEEAIKKREFMLSRGTYLNNYHANGKEVTPEERRANAIKSLNEESDFVKIGHAATKLIDQIKEQNVNLDFPTL